MIARLLFTAAAVTPWLIHSAPAFAEEAADAYEAADPGDAIVVTARRRAENLQDIPVAVAVVGGEALDAQGTYNISKLTQLQPTLQFFSTNPRNTFINIRGIGAPFGLTNDGFEQGVGVYIDQVYYNRIASATLDFVDVEQIEVLRGPQGTLYGKNTTAGAINITTRAPSFEFEGKAEVSLGNYNFKQAKASISGPLTENLAARLSLSSTDRRGTIYNVATDTWINAQDNIGIRGALLWEPSDDLSITFAGDFNLQNPICCGQPYARVGTTQRALNRQYAALTALFPGYQVPSTNPFDRLTDLDADLAARNELGGLSLRAEWDLGAGTLTSVTAWRYWHWGPKNDRDFTGLPVYTKVNNPTVQNQYTQELRYAHEAEKLDFVLGAFAFYQEIRTSGIQETGPAASAWLLNPTNALSRNPAVLNGIVAENDIRLDNLSLAAFGKVNWHVTDALTISPGIRINYDKKEGLYNSVVIGTASDDTRQLITNDPAHPYYTDPWTAAQRGTQASQFFEPNFSDWNRSYDLNIAYKVTDDILAYATYARSFKTGGINLNGVPNRPDGTPALEVAQIKPETVDHFEIGLKTQFWDRAATLNVTGFWTEIKDFQASVISNVSGSNVLRGYLANADQVRVRGIEADFSVRPSERLNAYISGAFTDHEFRKFVDAPCPPELAGGTTAAPGQTPSASGTPGGISPANCDVSGQWLPGVSKWAFSWGAEYNVPATILGREGEAYLGYDASYRSKFSSNASRSIYTDISGYSLHNFRAGFRTERFDIFGWVRNAFDQNYFESLAVTPGNTGLISAQLGDPKTWGGTIKFTF
ncbi:TonB-dependent receptor [Sphingosinicella microcystinivorans]|uniref:Iron complex outermembrane receptor protein n=1 Tax=Sphingosinicella microcystinivorans TaxID=335406 RepID=A0AAD1FZK1_SPHMI|nr:TonB-dependent receptor [Sphingosinicella microcystinivorans]RKS88821.1 iron complex outermembrane receptor protein [Sphingosinicella microcystinivorans]BBE32576.1 TonB-dependent receptor [Sphingosinicella microcystinivorans]